MTTFDSTATGLDDLFDCGLPDRCATAWQDWYRSQLARFGAEARLPLPGERRPQASDLRSRQLGAVER